MNKALLSILLLLPFLGGALLCVPALRKKRAADAAFLCVLVLEAIAVTGYLFLPDAKLSLFSMTESLTVAFGTDGIGRLFLAVGVYGFLLTGIYAVRYMAHGERQASFYAFLLFSLGALCLLCACFGCSGNKNGTVPVTVTVT